MKFSKVKISLCLIIFSAELIVFADLTAAQSQPGFKGLTAAEVREKFGNPDETSSPKAGEEVLKYGAAMFFLSNGQVVGVVGDNELRIRQRLRENIQTEPSEPRRDDLRGQWKTPWEPRQEATAPKN